MSLAFEPARHMEDETRIIADINQAQPAAPQPTMTGGPPSLGAIVLSDMLHVTNNLDPTQPVPADSAQAAIRHAVVVVQGSDHQLVPYLNVSMDLLLDGHPVTYGQTLVPMESQDGSAPGRVYYGNNIRLPARGTFQVFVRLQRTPLLGQDVPPAAQFNLAVN